MSEAEYLMSQEICAEYEPEEIEEYLEELRNERLRKMVGKYVIACKGMKGQRIYLQNRRISRQHFWTIFLSNALAFDSLQKAIKIRSKLRHNRPTILKVNKKLKAVQFNIREELAKCL